MFAERQKNSVPKSLALRAKTLCIVTNWILKTTSRSYNAFDKRRYPKKAVKTQH